MKPAAAKAYVRQLCCLGLGGPAIMPELLRALAAVIPSGPNVFAEVRPDFEPGYAILENPVPEALELYAREIQGAFRRVTDALKDWWRCRPGPVHWGHERAILDDFYRSDMYHHLWRPIGQHHALQGMVSERGRPLGLINLYRNVGEPPFSEREADELARLLPYVAHGLTARPTQDAVFDDSGRSGQIILDNAGRLTHQSETAKALLYLATHTGEPGPVKLFGLSVKALLKKLAGDLSAIAQGKEAPTPVVCRQNAWGRFVFRAYRLDAAAGENGLTLITVGHQEPRQLRLLRGLRNVPLSAKEREVCFWLAQGHSLTEVSRRLHVKPGTAKKYADAAYLKLDAHNRAELVERITAHAGYS